jgi:hypothetical protein
VVVLTVLSVSVIQAQHVVVATVDSLSGPALLQRAGANDWTHARVGMPLYNNDLFRTGDSCVARLTWFGDNAVYIHPGTQMLVHRKDNGKKEGSLRHFSVMYGALFFLIRSVVGEDEDAATKVYTPTSVVGIRGTSFSVRVDTADSSTSIRVLNGTVSTMTPDSTRMRTVRPGYTVRYRGAPPYVRTRALKERELDSLRTWVPSSVVDAQIARQEALARKEYDIITQQAQKTALVVPFVDSSGYDGSWPISSVCARIIATLSDESLRRITFTYMQDEKGPPMEQARAYGADYLVQGIIREFEVSQYAGVNAAADRYHERRIASMGVLVRIYDVNEGTRLGSEYFSHEVVRPRNEAAQLDSIEHVCGFSFQDTTFTSSIIGLAAQEVITSITDFIVTHVE